MKGYNMKGKRFSPSKKMRCKYKPMYHAMNDVRGSDLKDLNRRNGAEIEQKGDADEQRTDYRTGFGTGFKA